MRSQAVLPSLIRALGSAPASSRTCTTAGVLLSCAALWRGVRPSSSRALGSAPASSRTCTTAGVSLNHAAWWRGVSPSLVRALRSAPASSRTCTTAGVSLFAAAPWRGCKSTFGPCIGISAGIQQGLHHCWGLAKPCRPVEGCKSKYVAPCIEISPFLQATDNIIH